MISTRTPRDHQRSHREWSWRAADLTVEDPLGLEEIDPELLRRSGDILGEAVHRVEPTIPLRICCRLGYHICAGLPESHPGRMACRADLDSGRLVAAGFEALVRQRRGVRLGGINAPTGVIAGALRRIVEALFPSQESGCA